MGTDIHAAIWDFLQRADDDSALYSSFGTSDQVKLASERLSVILEDTLEYNPKFTDTQRASQMTSVNIVCDGSKEEVELRKLLGCLPVTIPI